MKQELVRSNPFEKQKCGKNCVICGDHPKVKCKVRDVDCEIMCSGKHEDEEKEIKYGGEISRSIGEKFDQHNDDIQKKKSDTHISAFPKRTQCSSTTYFVEDN